MSSLRIRAFYLIVVVLFAVGGCAQALKVTKATGFEPGAKTLRVAVLPLERGGSGQDEVAHVFREQLYANLQEGPYRLVEIRATDELLKELGARDSKEASRLALSQRATLQERLGVDAVIQSKIVEWSLTYLAIHSDVEFEVESSLIDIHTGQDLMKVRKGAIQSSGITKVPTGLVSAGLAPIKGLMKGVQQKVIDQLSRDIALVYNGQSVEDES